MADKHQGWILLYRSIRDHWIWERERVFDQTHAWIDLLLDVNHEERKIIIDGQPVIVGRGQKWTSVRTLADRWGWSRKKVQNFLALLQTDSMVSLKRTKKGTLLTVVNYDDFQIPGDTKGTLRGHQGDTEGTKQIIKELNNKRNTTRSSKIQNFRTTGTDYDDLAQQIMERQ